MRFRDIAAFCAPARHFSPPHLKTSLPKISPCCPGSGWPLGYTKSEDVGLIVVQLFSKTSNLCDPDPPTSQTDRQTDRRRSWRTTCNLNTVLCTKVHRAVIIMPHWVIRWAYHLLPILLRIFVIRLRSANCTGCWHNLLWQVDLLLNVIWLKYGMNRTFLELEPQSPSPLPIGLYKNIELLLVYYTSH